MKYRFSRSVSPRKHDHSKHPRYVLRGRSAPRRERRFIPIRMGSLFGRNLLGPVAKNPTLVWVERIVTWLRRAGKRLRRASGTLVRRLSGSPQTIRLLTGTLCATLTVFLLVGGVLALTLFGRYLRPGTDLVIPGFLQKNIDLVLAEPSEGLDLNVEYRENPNYPPGTVISQSPAPGVTRRIYGKQDRVTVTLTVCAEQSLLTLPSLAGLSRRDAVLLLKTEGMSVSVAEEESDTVPDGTVIRSYPEAGEHLARKSHVTLYVSRGQAMRQIAVPNLHALSENAARQLLEDAGLSVGDVQYQNHHSPVGTVVSQATAAGTLSPEHSPVSFTVSLGDQVPLKAVPSLSGMTVEEARAALRAVGLTLGEVTVIPHAAPKGTVIAQMPAAQSTITSSITAVDVTVSGSYLPST